MTNDELKLTTHHKIVLGWYDPSKENQVMGNNQELANYLRRELLYSRKQVQRIIVEPLMNDRGWDITIHWELNG